MFRNRYQTSQGEYYYRDEVAILFPYIENDPFHRGIVYY